MTSVAMAIEGSDMNAKQDKKIASPAKPEVF